MARYNKIYLGPAHENIVQTVEGLASAATAPGTVVERSGSNLVAHASAGEGGEVFVADIDVVGGGQIDDDIALGDTICAIRPMPQQELAVLVAAGEDVTAGDYMTSDGSGALAVASAGEEYCFIAQESYENDSSDPVLVRMRPLSGVVPA